MPRLFHTFGPDGAGKSTITGKLHNSEPGSILVSGTHPETWPDDSWYKETLRRNTSPRTFDFGYHRESAAACYEMVNTLLHGETELVIIDSDLRAQVAAKAHAMFGKKGGVTKLYDDMSEAALARLDTDVDRIGLHVTLDAETSTERASLLIGRIILRGNVSPFDPTTIEQAKPLVEAFDELEDTLVERNEQVVRIATNMPQLDDALFGLRHYFL